jgi:hypothetical protein
MVKIDMALTDPGYPLFEPDNSDDEIPAGWAFGAHTGHDLRHYLVGERSLTPLWRMLHGWSWDNTRDRSWDPYQDPPKWTKLDILKLFTRHKMRFRPIDLMDDRRRWMGMTGWEILRARFELPLDKKDFKPKEHQWTELNHFDQSVVGEMIRRKIPWQHYIWRMICYGHDVWYFEDMSGNATNVGSR